MKSSTLWRPQELPFETLVPGDTLEKGLRNAGQKRKPISIFICYAREDEDFRRELERHLELLSRRGIIDIWHDMMLISERNWEEEISVHIDDSQIIIILVSIYFMTSDYIYDFEVQKAMKRAVRGEARVIPIILRPTDWQTAPFAHLQVLPKDGRPVTQWSNIDQAFAEIAWEIRRAIEELRRK